MTEAAEKLETWQDSWLASHRDPLRFATGVLGILPYGASNPDNDWQLEKWQTEFLSPEYFFTDPDGRPSENPRHSAAARR